MSMLRNLFLAIFLLALALPALAVPVAPVAASETAAADCHGMPTENPDESGEQHGNSARLHGCIGCIAPVSPAFHIIQSAALPFITQSTPSRELSETVASPSLPPPRCRDLTDL
ncbi:MAG: hypothetical protein IBJ12_05730 [Sphingomonadaceae bacterium]|nr:hypothetical protein [Sphingomonadaceae bacterium]